MKKPVAAMFSCCLLAACASEPAPQKAAAAPPTLTPGQYAVEAQVTALSSTDKSPVPTFAKVGETRTRSGCVAADGTPSAALFADSRDICRVQDPYARKGRMNLTLDCTRKGAGKVMASIEGKFTADGFTATQTTTSLFAGSGDYRLVEKLTARKVADQCAAAEGGKA